MARHSDYELNRSGDNVSQLLHKVETLARVAETGSYNDLVDTPEEPAPEVFWAVYGTTTAQEVRDAVAAGKVCLCLYNGRTYYFSGDLVGSASYNFLWFMSTQNDQTWYARVRTDTNQWSSNYTNLERSSNKSQSVETDKTSQTKYPSTKAVADAIEAGKQVFLAEYGVTTASQIDQAVADGKAVMCVRNNVFYSLARTESENHYFSQFRQNRLYTLVVNRSTNAWQEQSAIVEYNTNKSQSVPTDRTSTTKYPSVKAVFDSLGKWGIISQTQTWTGSISTGYDYTMSDPVFGFIPLDFINTVGMFGAVFNETTGYFELNGLTDISYEEMRKIWYTGNLGQEAKATGGNFLQGTYARTNINTFTQIATGSIFMGQLCGYALYLEVFNYQGAFAPITSLPAGVSWCFVSNNRLKKILPVGLNANSTTSGLNNAFSSCYSLEDIYIKNVKIATSFSNSPRLKLESVVYLVQNAANTSAITITLHATAYARCQADTTEYTYNGQTYTGIIALATAKNISIASA